jgi:hypothetical protein
VKNADSSVRTWSSVGHVAGSFVLQGASKPGLGGAAASCVMRRSVIGAREQGVQSVTTTIVKIVLRYIYARNARTERGPGPQGCVGNYQVYSTSYSPLCYQRLFFSQDRP